MNDSPPLLFLQDTAKVSCGSLSTSKRTAAGKAIQQHDRVGIVSYREKEVVDLT